MLLGALLEAENTFLRTRDEAPKKERGTSATSGVPRPPGWITRYVGIDPEEGKRSEPKKTPPPPRPEQPLNTDGLSWSRSQSESTSASSAAAKETNSAAGSPSKPTLLTAGRQQSRSESLLGVSSRRKKGGPSHYQTPAAPCWVPRQHSAMKTTIDHLPDDQQQNFRPLPLSSRVLMWRFLSTCSSCLVRGRAAIGWMIRETGYKSDYDLLVVVENEKQVNDLTVGELERKVRAIIEDTPLTFIVHDIKFVNKEIRVGSTFRRYCERRSDALRQTAVFPCETEGAECAGAARTGGTEF